MVEIHGLIKGAEAARKATSEPEGIDVEIVITELGLIVRGTVNLGTCYGHHSHEVEWPEFCTNPALLPNAVHLVETVLREKQRRELVNG